MKLKGTHQLLVYTDDVNISGKNKHTMKKNTRTLTVASKKTVLKVNGHKTKHIFMSYKQNAGQSNVKIGNKSFERVQQFKYLGTSLTNENCNLKN